METLRDVREMKQTELYQELKKIAPITAIGQTRARKADLENMVMVARSYVEGVPLPSDFPSLETVNAKPEVTKVIDLGKKMVERQRSRKLVNINLTKEQRLNIRHGLEMLKTAGLLIAKSGLTPNQVGSMLYLATGVDPAVAGEAVFGLIALEEIFLGKEKAA